MATCGEGGGSQYRVAPSGPCPFSSMHPGSVVGGVTVMVTGGFVVGGALELVGLFDCFGCNVFGDSEVVTVTVVGLGMVVL